MKNTIIVLIVIIIAGIGGYFLVHSLSNPNNEGNTNNPTPVTTTTASTTTQIPQNKEQTVIGTSVKGHDIMAYHFGQGATELLFVGGIHGGYEWNTVLAAYDLIDYLKQNPSVIPANIKVTVIPVLNPDGLLKVVSTTTRFAQSDVSSSQSLQISGRFNGNAVDLNRNFDCDWKASGVWQTKPVSGGNSAFSEPESQAIKNYVETNQPKAVVAWFSSAGGVYSSSCGDAVSTETAALTNAYAAASGYPAHEKFDSYETSGDMTNWLAKNNIPAISVLLTNHTDSEWEKNKAGFEAILKYYTK